MVPTFRFDLANESIHAADTLQQNFVTLTSQLLIFVTIFFRESYVRDRFVAYIPDKSVQPMLRRQQAMAGLPQRWQFACFIDLCPDFHHGKQSIYIRLTVQHQSIHIHTIMKTQQAKDQPPSQSSHPESSLLDITYPYLTHSMLSRSHFYGFEVLIYLLACHFPIIYMILNYINKGYLLKWDVLETVVNNLTLDLLVCLAFLTLALLQIYIMELIIKIKTDQQRQRIIVYGYCLIWMSLYVSVGLYLISVINFYFTDRILIVVSSWVIPVKTFSYCLDRITGNEGQSLLINLKYMVSPTVIYKDFLDSHTPTLKIYVRYLVIKALTAIMCLLINYILITEVIAPYLQPSAYSSMSFPELFFRLTPLFFFQHMVLYYLIMENIMLALAELTQLTNRKFYSDWWNAETVSDFLQRWVFMINSFSDRYLSFPRKVKHVLHLVIIFFMLFSIFGQTVTTKMVLFAGCNIAIVFFFGCNERIQNNYIVHLLTVCFQPFTLAAALKYNIFR